MAGLREMLAACTGSVLACPYGAWLGTRGNELIYNGNSPYAALEDQALLQLSINEGASTCSCSFAVSSALRSWVDAMHVHCYVMRGHIQTDAQSSKI